MPIPLFALALCAFAIGTTEFVIMGLLPEMAADLRVSLPSAGYLVSGYALGVTIGAPILAAVTSRIPPKRALAMLMLIFIAGNLLCALSVNYGMLMVARVVTSFAHGSFFGLGAVVATSLVSKEKQASAIALMFTGLTLANVVGVPAGTLLGQSFGWRATFFGVTAIGVLSLAAILAFLPSRIQTSDGTAEDSAALWRSKPVWLAFATTVMFSASTFAVFTYIAPILRDVSGISPRGVAGVLLLIGVGLAVGNLIGGKLADRSVMLALRLNFSILGAVLLGFMITSHAPVPAIVTVFLWGMAAFAAVPALQMNVMSKAAMAPILASTLNIGAFNLGNALGAFGGGAVLTLGFGLTGIPLLGAVLAFVSLGLAMWGAALDKRAPRPADHARHDQLRAAQREEEACAE
ncbi:MAG: Inner membrane transport protein YdhP [Herbaspirillum frisingense]|uniref:Inner membrane transport protein YdhP n=1 Tax=Herbaspirillum frisingense TaxID=92645 RepID=A0A7V8FVX9_9BURK|nr:MAG: Inner membrane transport protein YdhP [Herbaspirillum frisingense]